MTSISFLIAEIISVLAIIIIYPQEFKDMALASEFQSTFLSFGSDVNYVSMVSSFTNSLNKSSIAIPIIMVGLICAVLVIAQSFKRHDGKIIALLIGCWVLPIDIILISNTYFLYHYFLLAFPCIVSVVIFARSQDVIKSVVPASMVLSIIGTMVWKGMKANDVDIITYSTVLLVGIHLVILVIIIYLTPKLKNYFWLYGVLLLSVCMFYWTTFSSAISLKYDNLRELNEFSARVSKDAYPDDWGDEPVLLLDSGVSTYYESAPSYSRYFYNLPMQRWKPEKEWEVQKLEYENMMNYQGKYILYSDWFDLKKYPDLEEKIDNEYEVMPHTQMYYHSPDWDIFTIHDISDAQDSFVEKSKNASEQNGTVILIRKQDT